MKQYILKIAREENMEIREEKATLGQIKTLVERGYLGPIPVKNLTKDQASLILRRLNQGHQDRSIWQITSMALQLRIQGITSDNLQVGMPVDASLRGGPHRRWTPSRITMITKDGYIYVEGSSQRLTPSRVRPITSS